MPHINKIIGSIE